MHALSQLLSGIVDYAGLFPPAGLPLDVVVENYATYRNGRHAWMLERLVVPAGRLLAGGQQPSLTECLEAAGTGAGGRVSALLPSRAERPADFAAGLDAIAQFNQFGRTNGWLVDAIETPASPDSLDGALDAIPREITCFVESDSADAGVLVPRLANRERSVYAKIRSGGVTPQMIPSADDVAGFMHDCHGAGVGFKATAGLHHPLPAEHGLTYADDAPRAKMHGFLNVFVGAAVLRECAISRPLLTELLETSDPDAFHFGEQELGWRDFRVSINSVRECRERFARSFGSCSFTEPVADLQTLALLPAD